jgi:hypothetical protein
MLANEMFLDSAVKRSSAASIAKHLGYTTRSARGARAYLNVTVNEPSGSPSSLTIERYNAFSTNINGTAYTFYNVAPATVIPSSGFYTFENLEVVEGTLASFSYVVETPGPDEKYEIPEINADTSTLRVTIQASASDSTTEIYSLATDITGLDGTSKVFFLEENPSGRYEIYFGDGVIGKKLSNKNIVNLTYLVSNGTGSNTSSTLPITFTSTAISGSTSVDISVVSNPNGARERETLTEIKFNAPLVNATKNRAVTTEDYKALVAANFSEAESIAVWGGEDNIPPKYGKVIISLKPFSGFTISDTSKSNLINTILKTKKVITTQPEIVDPDYYYVNLVIDVEYNSSTSNISSSQVDSLVRNVVGEYFRTELQQFDKDFNKSKLVKNILDSDDAIVSVLIRISLQKRKIPSIGANNSYTQDDALRFNNKIAPGGFSSSRFFFSSGGTSVLSKFVDYPSTMPPDPNGNGTLRIVNAVSGASLVLNAGVINYSTGVVTINDFIPSGLQSGINDIRYTAEIQQNSHNIQAFRNQILLLDDSSYIASVGRDRGLTVNVNSVT